MENTKIKNWHKGKFANEGKIFFPLFNTEIDIFVDYDVPPEYAEKCVEHLEKLSDGTIEAFCRGAINYCESFREFFDDFEIEIPENIKGRDILPYITPKVMMIELPQGEEPAFHMECACEWEIEHALEWTVRGNEVLYVGGFGDERPWRDREYFKNASWNYAELD